MPLSSAIDSGSVARAVGIRTEFSQFAEAQAPFLPQRIAIVAQGNTAKDYDTAKKRITSAREAAETYGYGSPIHLAARQLFPLNGDGVGTIPVTVYPLEDDAAGVAATITITADVDATGVGTVRVSVSGETTAPVEIANGTSKNDIAAALAAAVNANVNMPVTAAAAAAVVTLTAKWEGSSGDVLTADTIGAIPGVTLAVADADNGAGNPAVGDALALMGNVWETIVLNGLEFSDAVALAAYKDAGEGRWGALTRKPYCVFTGYTGATVGGATAVTDTRKDDRVNVLLSAPGSPDLPVVVAARKLARIAVVARNNPPHDYGSQKISGIIPGSDAQQWDYVKRNQAVSSGVSTSTVRDGVIYLEDVVTMYRPDGNELPEYRHFVDIVKLQNIIHRADSIFGRPEWDGAPLIPDEQPTTNPSARQPKGIKAVLAALADDLGNEAIISDPEFTKSNMAVEISRDNPKRFDVRYPVKLVGNTNVISFDLLFGFYFGQPPAPAVEDASESGTDPEAETEGGE